MARIGMLSDELSAAPGQACEMAALYGLRYLELRGWHQWRAPAGMSTKDMEAVRRAGDEWGIRWASISPGLFKVPGDSPERERHVRELWPKCLELAAVLGAEVIVSFTPVAPEEERGQWDGRLADELREMGEQAQQQDLVIAVENEPVCVAASARHVAELVRQVDHPAVGQNWDPGNDAHAGLGSGPDAWAAVATQLRHVHVKDYVREDSRVRVADVGEGDAEWRWIAQKLKEVDYGGLMILEPHDRPLFVAMQRAILSLRRLLAEAGVEW